MDPRLKQAIIEGKTKKEEEAEIALKKAQDAHQANEDFINSKCPQAREWIDNVLFKQIAKAEESSHPYRKIQVPDTMWLPGEAIYREAKTIEGIKAEARWVFDSSSDEDQSGEGSWDYYITWEPAT